MKVKELIKDTIWSPSFAYESTRPKISVLMPTYCRAKSGLFEKALVSILEQTFQDFELIIVDDASIDGTAEIIERYRAIDSRIHLLTHPDNMGLPAISEYEAFMKAKGEYFIFAFDDFVFEKDAFENLYNSTIQSGAKFCHGLAKLYTDNENFLLFGKESTEGINHSNTIANASVIIAREVFHQIGLYDPHILLTRCCDWDLWKRISKYYRIEKFPFVVGSEYGSTCSESLGNSCYNNKNISNQYFLLNRDYLLLPNNYKEFDILNLHELDKKLHTYTKNVLKFYQNKPWFKKNKKMDDTLNTKIKITICGTDTVNYDLCFFPLNNSNYYVLNNVSSSKDFDWLSILYSSDIVIFNRYLHLYTETIKILKLLKIECYYFIDDNFIEISDTDENLKWYTLENVKQSLNFMTGVLTSTEKLTQYYVDHQIHTHVLTFPPVLNKNLLRSHRKNLSPEKPFLRVAIVGGQFRSKSAQRHVIPALNKMNEKKPIFLYIRKGILNFKSKKRIKFKYTEFDPQLNYHQYIHTLTDFSIDVLIHPAGESKNMEYKTDSVLLSALYVNANIIVTPEPIFAKIGENQGVITVPNTCHGFFSGLQKLLIPGISENFQKNLHDYCLKKFDSTKNEIVLNKLISTLPPNYFPDITRYQDMIKLLNETIKEKNYLYQKLITYIKPNYSEEILSRSVSVKENILFFFQPYIKFILRLFENIKLFIKMVLPKKDLSNLIHDNFEKLMAYSLANGAKKENYILHLSSPLKKGEYKEYKIEVKKTVFSHLAIALECKCLKGNIGTEIVLVQTNQIIAQAHHTLSSLDATKPVIFKFKPIKLKEPAFLYVRIFSQEKLEKLCIYEFRKKGLNLNTDNQLFCEIY